MEAAKARFRAMFEATYPAVVRCARHRGLSAGDADDVAAGVYETAERIRRRVASAACSRFADVYLTDERGRSDELYATVIERALRGLLLGEARQTAA